MGRRVTLGTIFILNLLDMLMERSQVFAPPATKLS
jgi:VanZ family protein